MVFRLGQHFLNRFMEKIFLSQEDRAISKFCSTSHFSHESFVMSEEDEIKERSREKRFKKRGVTDLLFFILSYSSTSVT
jgi:hypothetical protein